MALKYLWDTNIVIYYLQNQFPLPTEQLIDNIVNNFQPAISVITEIELLCWKMATEKEIWLSENFIANSTVFELNNDIKARTIEIRKQYRIKLPDAMIAATAVSKGLTLISRNSSDFKKVMGLDFIDPFSSNFDPR